MQLNKVISGVWIDTQPLLATNTQQNYFIFLQILK